MTSSDRKTRTGAPPVRRSTWLTLLGLAALVAILAWTSLSSGRVECRVCMTYDGRTECATAAAVDRETAIAAATDTACAPLASGRAASLECGRTRPDRTDCR